MDTRTTRPFALHVRAAAAFAAEVLRAVTWRAVIVTQSLGLLMAVFPWLETLGKRPSDYLLFQLMQQMPTALFVMLAALAGDRAVRRGWTVWRAFVMVLLCASMAVALAQWGLNHWLGVTDPWPGFRRFLFTFFDVGGIWGVALMVYLNRQSARRILAGVRAGELARLQAERRLITSRLAATQTEVDPVTMRGRLAEVRDLYARGSPDADPGLERLIGDLRHSAARGVAAAQGLDP